MFEHKGETTLNASEIIEYLFKIEKDKGIDEFVSKTRLSSEDAKQKLDAIFKLRDDKETKGLEEELKAKIPNFNSYGFDINVYKEILPYTKLALLMENNGIAEEHAYKLTVLFGNKNDALNYLKKFAKQKKDTKTPLHDACVAMTLPAKEKWTLDTWRSLLKEHALDHRIRSAFANAPAIEKQMQERQEKLLKLAKDIEEKKVDVALQLQQTDEKSYPSKFKFLNDAIALAEIESSLASDTSEFKKSVEDIKRLATQVETPELKKEIEALKKNRNKLDKKIKNAQTKKSKLIDSYQLKSTTEPAVLADLLVDISYKNASKNHHAAEIFKEYDISEAIFDKYLELRQKDKDKDTLIPSVTIDGAEMGYPGYYLAKLPSNDPRAAILGKLTACCQSLGDQGEECAVHGITSYYGGFYVICKGNVNAIKEDDTIVSQCWAWRSENDNIVFDSVETQPVLFASTKDINMKGINMITRFFGRLAYDLVENQGILQVSVGLSGRTPPSLGVPTIATSEQPLSDKDTPYVGYRDSDEQRLVAAINMRILNHIISGNVEPIIEFIKEHPGRLVTNKDCFATIATSLNKDILQIGADELVKLSASQIDPQLKERCETALLRAAVELRDVEFFKSLVANGVNIPAKVKDSLLLFASKCGSLGMVKFLIEQNANINATNSANRNVLMVTLKKGDQEDQQHYDVAKYLITHKADIAHIGNVGETALTLAIGKHKNDIGKLLIENKADIHYKRANADLLEHAVYFRNYDMVKYFIEVHKFDPNKISISMRAMKNLDILAYLIEKKIDLKKQNSLGETMLSKSLAIRSFDAAKLLIEHGAANAEYKTQGSNWNLLHYACEYAYKVSDKQMDVIKLLVEMKVDPTARNSQGKSPIDMAEDTELKKYLQNAAREKAEMGRSSASFFKPATQSQDTKVNVIEEPKKDSKPPL